MRLCGWGKDAQSAAWVLHTKHWQAGSNRCTPAGGACAERLRVRKVGQGHGAERCGTCSGSGSKQKNAAVPTRLGSTPGPPNVQLGPGPHRTLYDRSSSCRRVSSLASFSARRAACAAERQGWGWGLGLTGWERTRC